MNHPLLTQTKDTNQVTKQQKGAISHLCELLFDINVLSVWCHFWIGEVITEAMCGSYLGLEGDFGQVKCCYSQSKWC